MQGSGGMQGHGGEIPGAAWQGGQNRCRGQYTLSDAIMEKLTFHWRGARIMGPPGSWRSEPSGKIHQAFEEELQKRK